MPKYNDNDRARIDRAVEELWDYRENREIGDAWLARKLQLPWSRDEEVKERSRAKIRYLMPGIVATFNQLHPNSGLMVNRPGNGLVRLTPEPDVARKVILTRGRQAETKWIRMDAEAEPLRVHGTRMDRRLAARIGEARRAVHRVLVMLDSPSSNGHGQP